MNKLFSVLMTTPLNQNRAYFSCLSLNQSILLMQYILAQGLLTLSDRNFSLAHVLSEPELLHMPATAANTQLMGVCIKTYAAVMLLP